MSTRSVNSEQPTGERHSGGVGSCKNRESSGAIRCGVIRVTYDGMSFEGVMKKHRARFCRTSQGWCARCVSGTAKQAAGGAARHVRSAYNTSFGIMEEARLGISAKPSEVLYIYCSRLFQVVVVVAKVELGRFRVSREYSRTGATAQ